MKKLLTMTLIFAMMLTTFAFAAEEKDVADKGYAREFGTVSEVAGEGKTSQILVESENAENENVKKVYLYTEGVNVIDLKTGEFVKDHKFEKGEKIEYFYKNNTPMMMSYPGKMTPGFIAINVEDAKYSIDVDYFDKEGHGISNRLKINVNDKTPIENMMGETVEESKGVADMDLLVLYTVATRSLPPITNPDKIVVLSTAELELKDYKVEDKDAYYMRKYYEAEGAKVEWNEEDNTTTITLGEKSVKIKNGEGVLVVGEEEMKMDGFTVEKDVSLIGKKDVEKINEYLMEK